MAKIRDKDYVLSGERRVKYQQQRVRAIDEKRIGFQDGFVQSDANWLGVDSTNPITIATRYFLDSISLTGTSGTSGTSGSSGTSGTSGITGTAGSSGTSGSSGSSGTSGTGGSNGTSGSSGTSGTSSGDLTPQNEIVEGGYTFSGGSTGTIPIAFRNDLNYGIHGTWYELSVFGEDANYVTTGRDYGQFTFAIDPDVSGNIVDYIYKSYDITPVPPEHFFASVSADKNNYFILFQNAHITGSFYLNPYDNSAGFGLFNRHGVVTGGRVGGSSFSDTIVYDAPIDLWEYTVGLFSPTRYDHSGTSVNEKGYVFGGVSISTLLRDTDEYDLLLNTWTARIDIPAPARRGIAATALNNDAYIAGGYANPNTYSQHNSFNQLTRAWSTKTSLPTARSYGTYVTGDDDKLYHVCGRDSSLTRLTTHNRYDPLTNTWSTVASATRATEGMGGAGGFTDKMFYFGGVEGVSNRCYAYTYTISTNTFVHISSNSPEDVDYAPLMRLSRIM
jgi:hypothetical protein